MEGGGGGGGGGGVGGGERIRPRKTSLLCMKRLNKTESMSYDFQRQPFRFLLFNFLGQA